MNTKKILQELETLDSRMAKTLEDDISKDYRIHVEGIRQGLSWAIKQIKEGDD